MFLLDFRHLTAVTADLQSKNLMLFLYTGQNGLVYQQTRDHLYTSDSDFYIRRNLTPKVDPPPPPHTGGVTYL